MCASAVESAMKAALQRSDHISATKLFSLAIEAYPELTCIAAGDLEQFRFMRNHIVHYGFTQSDEERAAAILLQIGIPLLAACYRAFFAFDFNAALGTDFARHLEIASLAYRRANNTPGSHAMGSFQAFGHLVRWTRRESALADWEYFAKRDAEENDFRFEHCRRQKEKLERGFGAAWVLECPVCGYEDFVCELDDAERTLKHAAAPRRGICVNCGLVTPEVTSFLIESLCEEQLTKLKDDILEQFGLQRRP